MSRLTPVPSDLELDFFGLRSMILRKPRADIHSRQGYSREVFRIPTETPLRRSGSDGRISFPLRPNPKCEQLPHASSYDKGPLHTRTMSCRKA